MSAKYDIKDLVGKRFGFIEVLSEAPKRGYARYVLCKCHRCGRVKEICLQSIIKGITKSCGCGHRKSLIGRKYGSLTVVDYATKHNGIEDTYWICKCDCGNIVEVNGDSLNKGRVVRCKQCPKPKGNDSPVFKHGLTNSRLMRIWTDIKARCYNPNEKAYKNYGGRGVKMCDEWRNNSKSFFYWALNNGYNETLTIDRINTNGNYEPSNCRWVDRKTQCNNQRNNHYVEYKGERLTISQLAEKYGLKKHRVVSRLLWGWSIEDAVELPKGYRHKENQLKK